jgi:hypothetical protein
MKRSRGIWRGGALATIAAALVGSGLILVTSVPAQAAPASGTETTSAIYLFQNLHTSRCLSDSFAGGLQVLACTVQNEGVQRWQDLTPTAPTFQLQNVHTTRCLTDSFAGGLQVLACTSPNTQAWSIRQFPDGGIRMQNVHTTRCLTDSFAGRLQVLACTSPNTAQWWQSF